MKNSLCLTWNILIGLFVFTSNAEAARATTLILGKSKPESKTDMLPTGEENISTPAVMSSLNETSSAGNVTKLTGVPQIDYIYDPNLPRELNGYNLTDYPFYNAVPEDIDFKCDGLHDGFYASVPHKCQVYHHCLFGTRYDFLCANYTAFDQKTFICHFASEVDCKNSPKYYNRNEALYKAATTTTNAPIILSDVKSRKPQSDYSGSRRKRPYRVRKPTYEYYDDEDEYEDFPERDYYYEEEASGSRRRKRPRPYSRDSFLEAEGDEEKKNKPGQHLIPNKSLYDRPRLPPKFRRPVPISERDKYDHSSDSRATKSKESNAEKQRQNDGDSNADHKGKKGHQRSEVETSDEEDRSAEPNKGNGRGKDGNDHGREKYRERNRQEDRVFKDRKSFRKRPRPESYEHSHDYEKEQEEEIEDDYYDDQRRVVRPYNNRPKHNGAQQADYDDRPLRAHQKSKDEENIGRGRDENYNYRNRQEPHPDKSFTNHERIRESEKKASKSKDLDHTSEKNDRPRIVEDEDRHRSSASRTEGGNVKGAKIYRHHENDQDYFSSESEEKSDKYNEKDGSYDTNYKSKTDTNTNEKANGKSRNREKELGRINIDDDYHEVEDEKYVPQNENLERGRNPSNRPVSSTRVTMKGKEADFDKSVGREGDAKKPRTSPHQTNFENSSSSFSDEAFEHEEAKSDERKGEQKSSEEQFFPGENLNPSIANSKSRNREASNNFSAVSGRHPGNQKAQIVPFKSKDGVEYKDYDEPVPAPRPAYITDISESTADKITRKRPNDDISVKRINPFRKTPNSSNYSKTGKIHTSSEESSGREEEADYYDSEDDGSEKDTKRKATNEGVLRKPVNQNEREVRLPLKSDSTKSSFTHGNAESSRNEHQGNIHHLKVPFENSENTEELAPRAPKNSHAIVSSRRRPFLPSRGGNPQLPRGLTPVGSRSYSRFSEKYERVTPSTEAAEKTNLKEQSNVGLRIPEKKILEFRTKVSASIGVEQPQLTSYFYDESPFDSDRKPFTQNNNRQVYSVQLQQKPKLVVSDLEMPNDDRFSHSHDAVGGGSKNIDIAYEYHKKEADNERERSGIVSVPFRAAGTEDLESNLKSVPSQGQLKPFAEQNQRKSENSERVSTSLVNLRLKSTESNFPKAATRQTPDDATLDVYLVEKNVQYPRTQILNSPSSIYNVPGSLNHQQSKIPPQPAPRLGPQVFYSENPKFKTTLVVPDHLVPKSTFSHLKYSTNSPARFPNHHQNHKAIGVSDFDNESDTPSTNNQSTQRSAASVSSDVYKNFNNRFHKSAEADVEATEEYDLLLNDALQPSSMPQSFQVPSRMHAQNDNVQTRTFKRRHQQAIFQDHQLPAQTTISQKESSGKKNQFSTVDMPYSPPTSLRQTIPFFPFHQISSKFPNK